MAFGLRMAACALSLLAATSLVAEERPFFRFGMGAGTPAQDPSGDGTTDTGTPAALKFGAATPIPTGATRDSRTGTYTASGGTAPYTMTLLNAPGSLALTPTTPNGSTYALAGDLGPTPNAYRSARIELRDSKSETVSFGVPFDVLEAPARPGPPALALAANDLQASFNAGSQTYSMASVTGGTSPYTWSITNGPSVMVAAPLPATPSGSSVKTLASISEPGVYRDVVLTVQDSAGLTASHTFAPFEVRANGGATPVVIGPIQSPPATIPVGGSWTSTPFTVTGGSPGDYGVYLEGGPSSETFKVNKVSNGTYTLTFAPTQPDVGRYAGVVVIARDPQGYPDTLAAVGPTLVPGATPLVATVQTGPVTVDPGTFAMVTNGGFTGGSGSYVFEAFGSTPDFNPYVGPDSEPSASGDGSQDLKLFLYAQTPGVYKDILVRMTDSKTGQVVDFARFDLTVGQPTASAGGPITACSTYWNNPPLTINSQDTWVIWDAIRVSGGVAPFTASYPAGSVPGSVGFAVSPEKTYDLANGMTGIEMSLHPSGPGEFNNLPVTIRDSNDTSCTVNVSVKVNPHGTPRI